MKANARARYVTKHFIDEPIDLFVDIGVGLAGRKSEAWYMHDKFPNLKIVGFEPNKQRYESLVPEYPGELRNNIVVSQSGPVYAYENATAKLGDTVLYTNNGLHGGDQYKRIQYDGISVDDLVGELEETESCAFKNIYIWADTEGSELEILKGCTKILNRRSVFGFNLEVRSGGVELKYGWPCYIDIKHFLASHGVVPMENLGPLNGHIDIFFRRNDP